MIEVKKIKKSFNNVDAVNIESLSLNSGEIVGLVGNNGAGKTTLLRLMLDLYKADAGLITSKGENVHGSEHWKLYTGSYLDPSFLIDFYTPEEFFYFSAHLYGISKDEVDNRLLAFEDFMSGEIIGTKKYIRNLSAGNQQKVGIVSSILVQPDVLILDEPFNFLDPSSQIILSQLIINLNKIKGSTIIVSSHNISYTTEMSSRTILMERGKVLKDVSKGSAKEISNYFSEQVK
ncbi:MAG: ABC transporter ATP-binding protein, partial [Methanobacteriaceae archaeon]|nr:ABC transporter ATP-binding protein [Methanobacteriaceae archaeon]